MKWLVVLVLGVGLSPLFGQEKLGASDGDYKEISQTLTRKSMALIDQDTVFLAAQIDEGFSYINSKGKLLNKTTYINTISKGKLKFISQRAEITSIVKIKQVYYLTANLKDEFIYEGKTVVAAYNTVNIFVKRRGKFYWIFGQSTEVVK